MSQLKLDQYRTEVCKILKGYFFKIKAYQFYNKNRYNTTDCCNGIDEELIGKCIKRMIDSDENFEEGKSKLDIQKYRRMNVIYEARSYIQQTAKYQAKYLPWYDFNLISEKHNPTNLLENEDERLFTIQKIKKSNLGYKHKKYMLDLLSGKALIDIAHENKTTRPIIERIINEGVLKLKG